MCFKVSKSIQMELIQDRYYTFLLNLLYANPSQICFHFQGEYKVHIFKSNI